MTSSPIITVSITGKGTTSVQCTAESLPEGELCGDEIEVEWEQHQLPPEKTGRKVCLNCNVSSDAAADAECEDFEGESGAHEWVDEYVEGNIETTIISARTWCFHPLTRKKCMELLDDLAVAQAEQRAEEGRI